MLPHSDPLWHWLAALRVRPSRLLLAVGFGVAALGTALALAGVSAWLITRAWQMPPILDLSVAVVAVRALGISRGIWRYCERLAGHDIALRGAAALREEVYLRLTGGSAQMLRPGEALDAIAADIDEVAETVVRSIIPAAVAAVLGIAATAVIAAVSMPAAAALAFALLVASVVSPALAAKAARTREVRSAHARTEHAAAVVQILDHAAELRLGGILPRQLDSARRRRQAWATAQDAAAGPSAWASAVPTLCTGAAVVAALVAAADLGPRVAPTTLAILVLLPLAAFEAAAALPAAAVGLTRSMVSATRLQETAGSAPPDPPGDAVTPGTAAPEGLSCYELIWRTGNFTSGPLTFRIPAGGRLAVTGPSGVGKTSLLTTIAGLAPPLQGSVFVGERPLTQVPSTQRPTLVRFFAEDAHLFSTTIRDNLLIARGDATDSELLEALAEVGLASWIDALADGLDTVLSAGASSLSGGQRRRLLLARALVSDVPVLLLDEPTEHLDATDGAALMARLLREDGILRGRTVAVATHHLPESVTCAHIRLGDTVQA